jgi:hypothetical protein
VGAEENFPIIYNLKPLARLLGFPYFPITPTSRCRAQPDESRSRQ